MSAPVNRWRDAEHARAYLAARPSIPHTDEGYAALVELVGAPTRVLDLGCGDGEVAARVLDAVPTATVLAVDFSEEMLARAHARLGDDRRVTLAAHDLDDPLPASWGAFDLVVSAFAIHHLVDERKRALYGEVHEVLRSGGRFLNLEHVASPTPELHLEFLAELGIDPDADDPSNRLAPVAAQLAWLADAGFEPVDCHWKWRELALLRADRPLE